MSRQASKSGLIWERLPPQRLDRDQIVRAAIAIADAEGAQAITMRRVASELGTAAMSLYRHIFSKEDLLDLMLDTVFGEIDLPAQPSGDWRSDLRLLAETTRSVLKRHMWIVPLLYTRPTIGPNYLRWFEFSLAAFNPTTLDIATTSLLSAVVTGYVFGIVGAELAEEENTRRTGVSEADKRQYATPYVEQIIGSGNYPNFARWFQAGVELDPNKGFLFGLDCLLDGIATQIRKEQP